MIESIVGLIVLVIVLGIVVLMVRAIIDMIPMDAGFKSIAQLLVILLAVLVLIWRALPLLGLSGL